MKFTAFRDLQADLRIRLATRRKSIRKFWFCKLASTCIDFRGFRGTFWDSLGGFNS